MDYSEIPKLIDEAYVQKPDDAPRAYIGASSIGQSCAASSALGLRGFPNNAPPPRLKRIFKMGHTIEDMVVADLKASGVNVLEKDLNGRQFEYKAFGGHVSTHIDGLIADGDDIDAVLEIKSMNDALWTECDTHGMRISHPNYFSQVQLEMGLIGVSKAVFVAYNKNTSEYLTQVIDFDEFFFANLQQKVDVIMGNEARKISADESDWRCRGCFKFDVCWRGKVPAKSCRTCTHAIADEDGSWFCTFFKKTCDLPCDDYVVYHPLPKVA